MFENIEGVVVISRDLYVKTPEALEILLAELRKTGYIVDNLREADYRKQDGVSVETMEKNGWLLWFAHLNVTHGKCGSCKRLISVAGIRSHGHKCELCGEVTYYEIVDGTKIRFSFTQVGNEFGLMDVTMKAQRWDAEAGYLYLYPEIFDGLWSRGDQAKQYFEANKSKWEEVEENGQRLIRVKYSLPYDREVSTINPSEFSLHYWNHQIVDIWEGKEYGEYSLSFPVPKTINVYETWHWAPLEPSAALHKKVLGAARNHDDKGWHYQDGTPWFSVRTFAEMGKFIRNFTTLDADLWDKRSKLFRFDGPGGIDDVAAFCHPNARGENSPNVMNLIIGLNKCMSGQKVSAAENAAMKAAAKDPKERKTFRAIFGNRKSQIR